MTELSFRCRCGQVRGALRDLAPDKGSRVVCYCDDCRAFARHLGRADLLDAHGGSDIFQVAPSQVQLSAGAEQLACVRLKPDGMLRWYARCCQTPLGNTVSGAVPFVGLPTALLTESLAGRGADEVLGPAVGVQGRFATPAPAPGAHASAPFGLMLRVVKNLARWKLTGRAQPSPYFDASGRPRAEPAVLTPAARAALAD
jgi:hypothetical protein